MARKMVTKSGMSEKLGPIDYGSSHGEVFLGRDFANTNQLSEQTSAEIDGEVKRLIDEAYARCEQLLKSHEEILHRLAAFLLEHETMDNAQLEALFKGETPAEEAKSEPLAQQREGDRSANQVMAELRAQEAPAAPQSAPQAPASDKTEQD